MENNESIISQNITSHNTTHNTSFSPTKYKAKNSYKNLRQIMKNVQKANDTFYSPDKSRLSSLFSHEKIDKIEESPITRYTMYKSSSMKEMNTIQQKFDLSLKADLNSYAIINQKIKEVAEFSLTGKSLSSNQLLQEKRAQQVLVKSALDIKPQAILEDTNDVENQAINRETETQDLDALKKTINQEMMFRKSNASKLKVMCGKFAINGPPKLKQSRSSYPNLMKTSLEESFKTPYDRKSLDKSASEIQPAVVVKQGFKSRNLSKEESIIDPSTTQMSTNGETNKTTTRQNKVIDFRENFLPNVDVKPDRIHGLKPSFDKKKIISREKSTPEAQSKLNDKSTQNKKITVFDFDIDSPEKREPRFYSEEKRHVKKNPRTQEEENFRKLAETRKKLIFKWLRGDLMVSGKKQIEEDPSAKEYHLKLEDIREIIHNKRKEPINFIYPFKNSLKFKTIYPSQSNNGLTTSQDEIKPVKKSPTSKESVTPLKIGTENLVRPNHTTKEKIQGNTKDRLKSADSEFHPRPPSEPVIQKILYKFQMDSKLPSFVDRDDSIKGWNADDSEHHLGGNHSYRSFDSR